MRSSSQTRFEPKADPFAYTDQVERAVMGIIEGRRKGSFCSLPAEWDIEPHWLDPHKLPSE